MIESIMKNLTCKTCGSNQFREEKNHYKCLYCNATIPKVPAKKSRRITLIVVLLFVIVIGLFMAYRLLFSVKEDISILTMQQHGKVSRAPSKAEIKHFQETNPYADLVSKVEKKSGEGLQQNTLEEALSQYYKQEKNKAFYIALNLKGEYAFGISYGAPSIQNAEREARGACSKAKASKKIEEACIPYAINNRVSQFLIETPQP